MLQFRSKKYQEKMKRNQLFHNTLKEQEQFDGNYYLKTQQEDFWKKWDTANEQEKQVLANAYDGQKRKNLISLYSESNLEEKLRIIEILGFIKEENNVTFLLNELESGDETLSIACAAALKRQDPVVVLEPMLDIICNPQNFAVARLYDILKDIGPLLVPYILKKIPTASQKSKLVMIQLLGEFGDESVIEVLETLTESEDYLLRKVLAEALGKIASPKGQKALLALLKDKNWQIRLLAAEALANNENEEVWQEMENAYIKETDKIVKAILKEALNHCDTQNIEEETLLEKDR